MALTRRGRLVVSVVGALALVAVGGIALALTGHAPAVIQQAVDKVTGETHEPEPPPTCPLTGEPAPARRGPAPAGAGGQGREHARRATRSPASRAPTSSTRSSSRAASRGSWRCTNARMRSRSAPCAARARRTRRSLSSTARSSVIAYSGGQLAVMQRGRAFGAHQLRRGARAATRSGATTHATCPHNLFVNTAKLRAKSAKATAGEGPPRRLFPFDEAAPAEGKHVSQVSMAFSYSVRRHVEVGQGRRPLATAVRRTRR